MLVNILSIALSFLFFVLGSIPFYWCFGGKWGLNQALPAKKEGELAMQPKKIDCISVGMALCFFGLVYLFQVSSFDVSSKVIFYSTWIIPPLFLIRAIGEFKYVGFFKKIKNTTFAKADTFIFSPLCLLIAMIGGYLLFMG